MICVCAYTDNGMWMLRDPYEYNNGPLSTLSKSFVICNLRILITSQFLMVDVSAYMIVYEKNLNIFVLFFKYQHFLKKRIAIKILSIVEIFNDLFMKTETKQTLSQILERLPYFNIKIIFLQVHACTKK